MKSAHFSKNPILIIDKAGLIGSALSSRLSKEFSIILVSGKSLREEDGDIVHIPFLRKFPVIPDSKYSHIVLIGDGEIDVEILPKIIEKAKDVNSDFIFAQGFSSKGQYLFEKTLSAYPTAKTVLYGDLFTDHLIQQEKFRSATN